MNTLTALAIVLQLSDAAQTCKIIKNGGYERNPFLPQNCAGIVAVKVGALTPLFIIKNKTAKKIWAISMISSGGIGIALSVKSR